MNNNCVEAKNLLELSDVLTSRCKALFSIEYPDKELRGFQGGCSDGDKYYYLAIMHYDFASNQEDNYSVIAKIDIDAKKVVKLSKKFNFHHANDMTYNPKDNTLIVCHNKPHKNRISVIDAETFEYIRSVDLDIDIYCIEYNEKRNCYLVGVSGTFDFTFLSDSFAPIGRIYKGTDITARYTKQGVCADDELIYFILWDGKHAKMDDFQNEIAVYDWNGNFKGVIEFNIGIREPENLSIVNGDIIAICDDGSNCPALYKIMPKLKTKGNNIQ